MTKNKSTPSTGGLALPATTAPLQPLLTPTSPADEALQALRDDLTAQMALQREEMLALQRQMMAQIQAIADRSPPVSVAPATAQLNTTPPSQTPLPTMSHLYYQQQQQDLKRARELEQEAKEGESARLNNETHERCVNPPKRQLHPRMSTTWKKRKIKPLKIPEKLGRTIAATITRNGDGEASEEVELLRDELFSVQCGLLENALKVFDENPERDKVTRTTVNQCGVIVDVVGLFYETGGVCLPAIHAIEMKNNSQLNGRVIRVMWSHRDSGGRRSGVGNVFVKNLSDGTDNVALQEMFKQFGNVMSCKVAMFEDGKSKGYGFVQFETEELAVDAIDKLNGFTDAAGKQLYVTKFVRKSERVLPNPDVKYTNLYVKNMDPDVREELLEERFSAFGKIVKLAIAMDDNGISKGSGFVNFESPDDAKRALESLNGSQLGSKVLYVARAQKKPEHASKITGMLLEMDNSELLLLLESPESLAEKVTEVVQVLKISKKVSSKDSLHSSYLSVEVTVN